MQVLVDALPYLDKEYDKPAMRDLVDRWALAVVGGGDAAPSDRLRSCGTRLNSNACRMNTFVKRAAVRAQILDQASAPRASLRTRNGLDQAHASVPARPYPRM